MPPPAVRPRAAVPAAADSGPRDLVRAGTPLYFSAKDATGRVQLYRSDGTAAVTTWSAAADPTAVFTAHPLGEKVVFFGQTGAGGGRVYASDGTVEVKGNGGTDTITVWASPSGNLGEACNVDGGSGGDYIYRTEYPGEDRGGFGDDTLNRRRRQLRCHVPGRGRLRHPDRLGLRGLAVRERHDGGRHGGEHDLRGRWQRPPVRR